MPTHHTFANLCAHLNRAPVYVRGLQRRFGLPIPADSPTSGRPPNRPTVQPATVPPPDRPTVRLPTDPTPSAPSASPRENSPNQEPRTKNEERGVSYIGPYLSFLETLIHLRVLGIPEETLLHLWTLERKLMQLLHADSTGSPTWFLDACGSTANPDHRLLLSNFDIGAYLPSRPNQEPRTKNQERTSILQLGLNFAGNKPTPELFTAPEMGEDAILVLRQYQTLHQEILTAIHGEIPILRAALTHFPPPRRHPPKHRQPRPQPKTGTATLIPGEI